MRRLITLTALSLPLFAGGCKFAGFLVDAVVNGWIDGDDVGTNAGGFGNGNYVVDDHMEGPDYPHDSLKPTRDANNQTLGVSPLPGVSLR